MLYITLKGRIYIKLRIAMISLMVFALIYSICVINRECKEWEQTVSESQKVNDIEETDKIVEGEEIKVESVTETTKQDVESEVETTVPIDYNNYGVPSNNSIKSYMDYRCITSRNSRQYQLQVSAAYTGNYGIRMVNGRYCVAVGSYYTTTIGQYIDIELENGNVIQGILADCKDDDHTDSTNRINPNGSVVEFVVDIEVLDDNAKILGDISCVNGWDSKIVNIKVYDFVEEF